MAITMAESTKKSVSAKAKVGFLCFSASVNASYSSKYSYSVEGSSLIRTKITPVPSNEFLRSYMEMYAQLQQKEMKDEMEQLEQKE